MHQIVVATKNPGKLREIQQVLEGLPVEVLSLESFANIPEPAEHGETFADNARTKALAYASATGRWCLADDSGLCVDALKGLPGVRSARYATDRLPADVTRSVLDAANNDKLLDELERRGAKDRADRSARFICCLALADGENVLIETRGVMEGSIAARARGENGFGYDPIFLVAGDDRTSAELSPEEKNRISHRGQAVREFARRLGELLQSE